MNKNNWNYMNDMYVDKKNENDNEYVNPFCFNNFGYDCDDDYKSDYTNETTAKDFDTDNYKCEKDDNIKEDKYDQEAKDDKYDKDDYFQEEIEAFIDGDIFIPIKMKKGCPKPKFIKKKFKGKIKIK